MAHHSWTELAALHAIHPTLTVFDYDLGDMDEAERTVLIAGQLAQMHNPLCRAQMACAHLGFVIGTEGVDVMHDDAVRLAAAFDERLSHDAFLLSHDETQAKESLAELLGFDDEKSIVDNTWQVTQLVELISLIGHPSDHEPAAATGGEIRTMLDMLAVAGIPKVGEPETTVPPKGHDDATVQKTAPNANVTATSPKRHDEFEGLMFGISEQDRGIVRKAAMEARIKGVDYVDALKVAIRTIRLVRC